MFLAKNTPQPPKTAKTMLKVGARKLFWTSLVVSTLMISPHVQAQEKTNEASDLDTVIFSLDGKEYTNRDLATASLDFQSELERISPQNRRDALIEIMINMHLLAKEGEKEKIHETEEYKRRLDQLRARSLRNFYISNIIRPLVTEELLQERYVELLARFKPQTEIRARHILVETEETAKALIKELDGGKDFAELAIEKSTGPSGPNGGDLGFFGPNQMVAPFQEAAAKMQLGEYSKTPVKTQFGWHVIKVEETRQSTAPTYDRVKAELQERLFNEFFANKVIELRENAKIEIVPKPGSDKPAVNDKKKAE